MAVVKADPQKAREWQRRGAERYAERQRQRAREPQARSRNRKPARNDSEWRADCIAAYGNWCRNCGASPVEMDHIWPRGQGGKSDVRNGLPLCPGCHEKKTRGTLLIRPEWLTDDQIEYLAEVRWVRWEADGLPYGRGYKHFAAKVAA